MTDVVFGVLQTLQEQDEILAEALRKLVQNRRTKGYDDSRLRERVEFIAPLIPLTLKLRKGRIASITSQLLESGQKFRPDY